jgi:hypothetical protein
MQRAHLLSSQGKPPFTAWSMVGEARAMANILAAQFSEAQRYSSKSPARTSMLATVNVGTNPSWVGISP